MKLLIIFLFLPGTYLACSVEKSGVTEEDRKIIVDAHNKWRRLVKDGKLGKQPQAQSMPDLKWYDCLGEIAQEHAKKCEFKHDQTGCGEWKTIGQNIYMTGGSDSNMDWPAAVEAWVNEHEVYKFKKADGNHRTGHYTQVVWAKTLYVGCDYAYFEDGGKKSKMAVCNYAPPGNMRGEYPYDGAPVLYHSCYLISICVLLVFLVKY